MGWAWAVWSIRRGGYEMIRIQPVYELRSESSGDLYRVTDTTNQQAIYTQRHIGLGLRQIGRTVPRYSLCVTIHELHFTSHASHAAHCRSTLNNHRLGWICIIPNPSPWHKTGTPNLQHLRGQFLESQNQRHSWRTYNFTTAVENTWRGTLPTLTTSNMSWLVCKQSSLSHCTLALEYSRH